jgi:serine/threonine-protein kinase
MDGMAAHTMTLDASFENTDRWTRGPTRVEPDRSKLKVSATDRYDADQVIGKGGMGEIRLARDSRIGRDVAMKVIRANVEPSAGMRARFVREACLQGQLEHPAIVPVYDLDFDEARRPFFTMKLVHGLTLKAIIKGLRDEDDSIRAQFSRRKLLTAFTQVCLAIDFAHQSGVIHRDLKPANIMLGNFGEVYVLDWGVANMIGAPDLDLSPHDAGAIIGTPGYMAPEQIGSPNEKLGPEADIYALGAILFEILTLERLQPIADLSVALRPADARASFRFPKAEVPPELEAICVKATAFVPNDRHRSARELAQDIERYLDGDRDLELRKRLAANRAELAAEALEASQSGPLEDEAESRSVAMREIGRAVALDPENTSAIRTMVQLLLEPPRTLPEEAWRALAAGAERASRTAERYGSRAYLACLLPVPMYLMLGVRNWTLILIAVGLTVAMASGTWISHRLSFLVEPMFHIRLVLSTLSIALMSRQFGPLVLVPTLAAANTCGYALSPYRVRRPLVIALGCCAIAVPALLEWTGVIEESYRASDGMMCIVPHLTNLPAGPTLLLLLVANVGMILLGGRYVGRVRDSLLRAEEKLRLYTWHLGQMVPKEIRGGADLKGKGSPRSR